MTLPSQLSSHCTIRNRTRWRTQLLIYIIESFYKHQKGSSAWMNVAKNIVLCYKYLLDYLDVNATASFGLEAS